MSVSSDLLTRAMQLNLLTLPPRVPARNAPAPPDADAGQPVPDVRVPRFRGDDYCDEIVAMRRSFVEDFARTRLHHTRWCSFDPHVARGNCEHFVGVAQVPLGIAGPLRVNGEHAQGDFLVPLATSEGTLVASYNRGMQVLNACGGVKCTVVADAMQRAPVFVLQDARRGRELVEFVRANFDLLARMAETTSNVARLIEIETYAANKFVFLRFNFYTGDAAGQNMVTKATYAACQWLVRHFDGIERYYLEGNLATDKKASSINSLRTRGKRVTAEAIIKRELMHKRLHAWPEQLAYHNQVANVGAYLSGCVSNGLHTANAITAISIATGQDVANVAESSAAIVHTELTAAGDLYMSVTIPSLIVATFGGGTGLPTQRECLEIMGCYGKGQVLKFAEIVAGTVLAGELSLACAISASEWVSSHERMGRNRGEDKTVHRTTGAHAAGGSRRSPERPQAAEVNGNGNGRASTRTTGTRAASPGNGNGKGNRRDASDDRADRRSPERPVAAAVNGHARGNGHANGGTRRAGP